MTPLISRMPANTTRTTVVRMRTRVMQYWEFFPDQLQTQYKRCIGPPRSQM